MPDEGDSMDELVFEGQFFSPWRFEERLGGVLRIRPGLAPRLRVYGTFKGEPQTEASNGQPIVILDDGDWQVPDPLWGEAFHEGAWEKISLLGVKMVRQVGVEFFGPEFFEANVGVALIGCWLESAETSSIEVAHYGYSHVFTWLGAPSYRVERDEASHRPEAVHLLRHDAKTFRIPEIAATLDLGTRFDLDRPSRAELSLESSAPVRLSFDESISVRQVLRYGSGLQQVLTLLIGEPVFKRSVSVLVEPPDAEAGVTSRQQATVHFGSAYPWSRPEPTKQLFTRHQDVEESLPAIMQKWFADADVLQAPGNLLVDALFRDELGEVQYRDVELMNLSQAAEGIHRSLLGGTVLEGDEFREAKGRMKSAIREHVLPLVPNGLGEPLLRSLSRLNDKSFKTRLTELVALAGMPAQRFISDVDTFAARVRDTRDYVAHREPSLRDKAAEGVELYTLNLRMKSVLMLALLSHLGVTQDVLERRMEYFQLVNTLRFVESQQRGGA